jgi:hypothetical protein
MEPDFSRNPGPSVISPSPFSKLKNQCIREAREPETHDVRLL